MSDRPMETAAVALLTRHAATVGTDLAGMRALYVDAPPRIVEAVYYSLDAGGKRLRPALVLETAAACGGGGESAVAAAAAIELVHTFSLVHDDLPAMDDDDLRRGRPTNHKVFGEAVAILAGDAMVAMAFERLAGVPAAGPLVRELARATGPVGMIGGQVLDIASEGVRLSAGELGGLHRMKTGALLTAACRMGAIAAGRADLLGAVTGFGRHIGLAFQIVDDILDETATPEQLGKAVRKDAAAGKNTYPALFGVEQSRQMAQAELAAAVAALGPLGPPADGLRLLARYVVERRA